MSDAPAGGPPSPSSRAFAGLTERGVWIAACAAGAGLRLLLLLLRPLWHDEIYTVDLNSGLWIHRMVPTGDRPIS